MFRAIVDLFGIEPWDFSERRTFKRVPCCLEGTASRQGKVLQMNVEDLSYGGAKATLYGKVRKGQVFELHVRKHYMGDPVEPIKAAVRWCRQDGVITRCGLKFIQPENLSRSWVYRELKNHDACLADEVVWVPCLLKARVGIVYDRRLGSGTIKSLSRTGARIIMPRFELPKGNEVVLSFGPLEHLPKVCIRSSVSATRFPEHTLKFEEFREYSADHLQRYLEHFWRAR